MPFIPVPDVVQAELIFTWNGQVCENVLHYESDSPASVVDMQDLGDFLISWWTTQMDTLAPTTMALTQIKLTDLRDAVAPSIIHTTGLPASGTAASPSLPNNVAVVFTKRTLLRGRSFRGRIYHMGLTEGQVTDNALSSVITNDMIDRYNLILEATTASNHFQLVVVSRFQDNIPRAAGLSTDVTHFSSDGVVDSQRRRLPGRGA